MINLFRRSVRSKIATGYIFILTWVFLISGFLIIHYTNLSSSMQAIYIQASAHERYARAVLDEWTVVNHAVDSYLVQRDESSLEDAAQTIANLRAYLAEESLQPDAAYSQHEYNDLREAFDEFETEFHKTKDSIDAIEEFNNQTLIRSMDSIIDQLGIWAGSQEGSLSPTNLDAVFELRLALLKLQENLFQSLVTLDDVQLTFVEESFTNVRDDLVSVVTTFGRGEPASQIDQLMENFDGLQVEFQGIKTDIQQLQNFKMNQMPGFFSKVNQLVKGLVQRIQVDADSRILILKQNNNNFIGIISGLFLFLVVMSLLYLGWLSTQISTPLQNIITVAAEVAGRDLVDFTSDLELLSKGTITVGTDFSAQPVILNQVDEIGRLAKSLNAIIMQLRKTEKVFYAMADYLNRMSITASNITHDHLDIEVQVQSENDVLGNAFVKMIDSLQDANIQVKKQLSQLTTLREIDAQISANIELKPTLQFILDRARQLLNFKWGNLVLMQDRDESRFETLLSTETPLEDTEWMVQAVDYIRSGNHLIYVDDIHKLNDAGIKSHLEANNVSAWFAEALIVKGQFKGVFQLFCDGLVIADEQNINYFSTLVGEAQLAIEHAELLYNLEMIVENRTNELNLRARQTQTAAEISHAATSTLKLEELITQSVNLIQEQFKLYYVGLFLVDDKNEYAMLRAGTGDEGRSLLASNYYLPLMETSMVGWSILHGRSRVATNVRHDPVHYRNPALPETRSEAALPLITRGNVIGALSVQSDQFNAFPPFETTILQTIADQLANIIANARLYQESQREKNFLESIIRTSSVAVVIMDLNEMIQVWNPAAESLFGWSAAEALGNRLADLVIPTEQQREASLFRQVIDEGKPIHQLTQRKQKDGQLVDVELSATLVSVEGGQAGILVLYHDITELQHSRNAALLATKAKSEFLANISHEIRNPLNAVHTMSGLLLETSLSVLQQDYTDTIRQNSEALLTLLNDILDFSKIEARRLELDIQEFELRACIESAMDLVAFKAAEKNLDIGYFIHLNTPNELKGDFIRLRQVLINILNNAVKFTDSGEVVVEVKSKTLQDNIGDEVLFIVKDTGIGIDPGNFSKLFQSFSQEDVSTATHYGGTGLGLAISKQLVELMGGHIWVESSGIAGEGAVFYFTITNPKSLEPKENPENDGEIQVLRGVRGLVGMHKNMSSDFMLRQLLMWGVQVEHHDRVSEVLDSLEKHDHYSLIILDMGLLNGVPFETKNKHRSIADFLQKITPSMRSRLIMLAPKGAGGKLGPDDLVWLEKPVKHRILLNILKIIHERSTSLRNREISFSTMAEEFPLRILVVEDNPVNIKIASIVLAQLGYQADFAENGTSAIDKIHHENYDVVLMDIHMPSMNGLEASQIIRDEFGTNKPTIIAMTADDLSLERNRYTMAGMDGYIVKPILLMELKNLLLSVIGMRKESMPVVDSKPAEHQKNRFAGLSLEQKPHDIIDTEILFDYFPQLTPKDRQSLNQLIGLFIEETPDRINDLKDAVAKEDLELARNAAHTLKGTSLTFGAVSLSNTAIQIENEIRKGDLGDMKELIDRVEIDFIQTVEELKRIGGIV